MAIQREGYSLGVGTTPPLLLYGGKPQSQVQTAIGTALTIAFHVGFTKPRITMVIGIFRGIEQKRRQKGTKRNKLRVPLLVPSCEKSFYVEQSTKRNIRRGELLHQPQTDSVTKYGRPKTRKPVDVFLNAVGEYIAIVSNGVNESRKPRTWWDKTSYLVGQNLVPGGTKPRTWWDKTFVKTYIYQQVKALFFDT